MTGEFPGARNVNSWVASRALWELRQGRRYQATRSLAPRASSVAFSYEDGQHCPADRTTVPQRFNGARPEASGVARPILAPSSSFQASTPAKLTTLHLPKPFSASPCRCTQVPMYLQVMALRSARTAASRLPSAHGIEDCSGHDLGQAHQEHRHLRTPEPCRGLKLLSQAAADATESLTGVNSAACGALWSLGVQLQQRRCGGSRTPRLLHAVLRLHALLWRASSVLLGSP